MLGVEFFHTEQKFSDETCDPREVYPRAAPGHTERERTIDGRAARSQPRKWHSGQGGTY